MSKAFEILSAALDEAIADAKQPFLPRHQLSEEQSGIKPIIANKKRSAREFRKLKKYRREIEQ